MNGTSLAGVFTGAKAIFKESKPMVRILSLIALLSTTGSFACSCFDPQTFCETLDPPYAAPWDPEWWIPDVVIMGVKLADEAHGMDIKVVDVFAGAGVVVPDQVVRVWGDCVSPAVCTRIRGMLVTP